MKDEKQPKTYSRTSAAPTAQKKSWKPLFTVLKGNVPILWYIANLILSLTYGYFGSLQSEYTGQIMAGSIFDADLIFMYVILGIANLLMTSLYTCSVSWAGYRTERNIQRKLWKKMIRMPMEKYEEYHPSTLITRMTSDTTMATTFLADVLSMVYIFLILIMYFYNIISFNRNIGLLIMLLLPYTIVIAIIPGRFQYKYAEQRQSALAKFAAFMAERLGNICRVKAAAAEETDIETGDQIAEEYYKAEFRFRVVSVIGEPFGYLMNAYTLGVTLILGGVYMAQGLISNSQLVTLYLWGNTVYSMLLMTISMFWAFKELHGATSTIGEIMTGADEEDERKESLEPGDREITFHEVSFSRGEKEVLSNVSFSIPNGKVTAIVGPSGAGKTTLLNLLERFYTPTSGRITYGERDIEEIHLHEWRSAAGYIQQNSPLFAGTIRENIIYGLHTEDFGEKKSAADIRVDLAVGENGVDDLVVQAAQRAGAYGFIMGLPFGFETEIGMSGSKLSGGERQRIALARMLVGEPGFLFLDEATSNLDAENEKYVQEGLRSAMKGRTSVVVAHKLRTVLDADQIIVLNGGKVVAAGKHNELYDNCELYRTLVDLQMEVSSS